MIAIVLAVAAVVATVIAIRKHRSLNGAIASAKKEAANLETAVVTAEATVKADVLAIVERLREL